MRRAEAVLERGPRKESLTAVGVSEIPFLVGKNIYLRALTPSDADGPYPAWLNNAEVCLENQHHRFPYTVEDGREYIQRVNSDRTRLVLAVVRKKDDVHIGNISLDNIDYVNRTAALTILIGDKASWGKGYGREAARLICDHGFLALNLNRIAAGTFETNIGFRKVAAYLGMKEEGRRRQAAYKLGRYLEVIEYGVLRGEYLARFGLLEKQRSGADR